MYFQRREWKRGKKKNETDKKERETKWQWYHVIPAEEGSEHNYRRLNGFPDALKEPGMEMKSKWSDTSVALLWSEEHVLHVLRHCGWWLIYVAEPKAIRTLMYRKQRRGDVGSRKQVLVWLYRSVWVDWGKTSEHESLADSYKIMHEVIDLWA